MMSQAFYSEKNKDRGVELLLLEHGEEGEFWINSISRKEAGKDKIALFPLAVAEAAAPEVAAPEYKPLAVDGLVAPKRKRKAKTTGGTRSKRIVKPTQKMSIRFIN
jgi:hypothetical protein